MEYDINSIKNDKTPSVIAVEEGNFDLIQLLLTDIKIDVNISVEHRMEGSLVNLNTIFYLYHFFKLETDSIRKCEY